MTETKCVRDAFRDQLHELSRQPIGERLVHAFVKNFIIHSLSGINAEKVNKMTEKMNKN